MNKGVIIGIIVAGVIIAGGFILVQNSGESDTTIIVNEIDNNKSEPKSFEVGLSESIGIKEP